MSLLVFSGVNFVIWNWADIMQFVVICRLPFAFLFIFCEVAARTTSGRFNSFSWFNLRWMFSLFIFPVLLPEMLLAVASRWVILAEVIFVIVKSFLRRWLFLSLLLSPGFRGWFCFWFVLGATSEWLCLLRKLSFVRTHLICWVLNKCSKKSK